MPCDCCAACRDQRRKTRRPIERDEDERVSLSADLPVDLECDCGASLGACALANVTVWMLTMMMRGSVVGRKGAGDGVAGCFYECDDAKKDGKGVEETILEVQFAPRVRDCEAEGPSHSCKPKRCGATRLRLVHPCARLPIRPIFYSISNQQGSCHVISAPHPASFRHGQHLQPPKRHRRGR